MGLREYKAKRDFKRTPEPFGKIRETRPRAPFFVVQKHAASRLHYDFRLELEGVLKSWAVPKGFPTTKGDKRLAVEVEDHPIDYANFEGAIAPGNYGAGTVMVWDRGTYEVPGDNPVEALRAGKLHLTLRGEKLNGEWTLVRMRGSDAKPQWLLLKSGSDVKPISPRADDQSVLTRRTMKQIATQNKAQGESHRPASKGRARHAVRAAVVSRRSGGQRTARPTIPKLEPGTPSMAEANVNVTRLPKRKAGFIEPMKAQLREDLPKGKDWIYEIKFDGVRALGIKDKDTVELISRNEKDLGGKYPQVVEALRELPAKEVVLDGEVCALDEQGRPSFQLLQCFAMPGKKPPLFYYVFDVIQIDGKDLTGLPLTRRKAMAEALLQGKSGPIRFSAGVEADSERVLKEMKARGLEGLIAKRRDSKYEIGRRSGAWVKFKWTNEQEFVIGGFTAPKGTRKHFGSVLVGYYESKRLLFASKVGTGFDQKTLDALHAKFQKLIRSDSPFDNVPTARRVQGSQSLSPAEMRRCTWLEPKLVCQIRFSEWTRDGGLRQPVFLGLREDKNPVEVAIEQAREERGAQPIPSGIRITAAPVKPLS